MAETSDSNRMDTLWAIDPRRCTPEAPSLYVLERYRLKREFAYNAMGAAARYRSTVAAFAGWKRVFLSNAVTGVPGTFTQLFRIPKPFDPAATRKALEAQPAHAEFFKKIEPQSFERRFLCPLQYDPVRTFDPADEARVEGAMNRVLASYSESRDTPETVILIDEFEVLPAKLPDLIAAKEGFFKNKVGQFGWDLIAAATDIGGQELPGAPIKVFQIWTLPNSNRLILTMRAMSQELEYRTKVLPCIVSEQQHLEEPRAGQ